jgi:hypothetical protein
MTQERGMNRNPRIVAMRGGARVAHKGHGRGKALYFAVQRRCRHAVRKESVLGQVPL